MEGAKMSQKEYLRKYLSGRDDGARKKKKRKQKFGTKTVTIVDDDDVDVKNMRPIEDGEFEIFNDTEDAPRIVGVVDERGRVDFTDERRWKIIADDGDGNVACSAGENRPRDAERDVASRGGSNEIFKHSGVASRSKKSRDPSDDDASPPRAPVKKRHPERTVVESRSTEGGNDYTRASHRKKSRRRRNERNDTDEPSAARTYDSDLSPPRVKKKMADFDSPTRKNSESDQSPPRRRGKNDGKIYGAVSSERRPRKSRSSSPPRASTDGRRDFQPRDDSRRGGHRRGDEKTGGRSAVSRWSDERPSEGAGRDVRMKKTLDGKTAGLQDARGLRIETEAHKKREAELFKGMSAEVSGAGQAAVLRDRRTGRKRDLAAEAAERREKEKRREEMDERYAKWGKGLKQVEDRTEKRKRDLFEMSKPLARYANDPDLERELREVEREGDTMLNEIKKRRMKQGELAPEQPSYQGSYLPNRFGIKPGHRWDGVDRSTGYEKKWFDARNARTALREEAYKWSTADM